MYVVPWNLLEGTEIGIHILGNSFIYIGKNNRTKSGVMNSGQGNQKCYLGYFSSL